jgi:5-formyltetrahydrofolate cyclo-ligase
LRRKITARRRALPVAAQRAASAKAGRNFWRLPAARRARVIACYAAVRGEISCEPIVSAARKRGVTVYMPVIQRNRLAFMKFVARARTRRNRFRIPEPLTTHARKRPPAAIDVIVMPLVAFDPEGRRLGTGGGYYDLTLQSAARRNWRRLPFLVGIAYDFQCVAHLPERPWDVLMHAIVTETKCITLPH